MYLKAVLDNPQPLTASKLKFLAWVILATLVGSCAQDSVDPTEGVSQLIQISPNPLKLPLTPFGGSSSGEFVLKNISGRELNITGIGPTSCDCVVAEAEWLDRPGISLMTSARGMNLAFATGRKLRVSLNLDTARYREPITWKSGRIPVSLGEDGFIGLDFQADIWTPFWQEPWLIKLGEIGSNDRASGFLMVRANEIEEFKILAPTNIDGWELSYLENRDNGELRYRIDVTAPAQMPEGPFAKAFSLATDVQGAQHIKFSVQANVLPDLVLSPSRLIFAPEQGRTTATLQIHARATALVFPHPPEIELQGAGVDAIKIERREVEVGKRYDVLLSIPKDAVLDGAKLIVHTGLDENPAIATPIILLKSKN